MKESMRHKQTNKRTKGNSYSEYDSWSLPNREPLTINELIYFLSMCVAIVQFEGQILS